MRMVTIPRVALLALVVLATAAVACTAPAERARERRDEAQAALASRAGFVPGSGAPAPGAAAPAGGGASSQSAAKLGQALATKVGCAACHTPTGAAGVGPTWKGLFGASVELASGGPVTADENYLRESILNPNAKIVKGFQPGIMPPDLGKALKDEEVQQLIEYIKTLK